jgi:hypothetical protein
VTPTARDVAAFLEQFPSLGGGGGGDAGGQPEWLEPCSPVAAQYGSVARYLADHVGIGATGLARLRANYLDPE